MSAHGKHIADNKLMLLDHEGNLVWYTQETGAIHNIQVQQYKGDDYITYWVGDDEFYGHGAGFFKMVRITNLTLCASIIQTHSVDSWTKHTRSRTLSVQSMASTAIIMNLV